ncbi:MAG: hypothetical protein AB7O32_14430 [Vicinamibacterales bacterium]
MPRQFDPHDAIRERVRLAEPVARRILLAGLGGFDRDEYARQTLHDFVKELTGYGAPVPADPAGAEGDRTTAFAQYEENLHAAYALGIALGLMLQPDEGAGDAEGG